MKGPTHTKITELFGIRYPIIQGGMQWLATAELAAAVSNAGGLGILNATRFQDAQGLVEEIRRTRALTDRPFAVNISMLPKKDVKDRTGEYFEAVFQEKVPVVETSGRSPREYIQRLHACGVKIIHKCPAVRYARSAQRAGADAVTLVGFECAGHPGMDDVSVMTLIPRAADELSIPVVAGGGVADARGFLAALALGAEGVVMGTRFVATEECAIHPNFKRRILDMEETDTMLVQRSLRNANRVLKNAAAERTLAMEARGATIDELLTVISGKVQRACYESGDTEGCLYPIGQCAGLIHDVKSVAEVIQGLVSGAQALLGGLAP